MRIVVTGASGQLGRLVVASLLERVPASDLILVSRTPESLAEFGAELRYGDFEHPESLPAAFQGGERALVISTIGARDGVAAHRAAFEAAARSGIRQIVYTSVPNPVEDNPFPAARTHVRSEPDLRESGVEWTILRNSLYAELRVRIAEKYVRDGRWTTNCGDGGHPFVARTDCAEAAAVALTTDGHAGKTYDITGPELVDARRYSAFLEDLAGRPIACEQVDDAGYDRYRAAFAADPANAAYFELFTGTGQAIRGGQLGGPGAGVQELTGRPPLSLEDLRPGAPLRSP
ncbi:NAD(P)H-binding protein [Amycolatopsis sp. H20-H5]|uniref:NAD(P)H-binding protein n=1 Tax=Amycolatopsis sp. H20-H5 TaxID=3046309 RepID=UPI002DB5E622|nr:NAD(P)H-binding protein [Amycolatopsis sp. H20-H5]MEC3973833.1 NAD(P)H-binding protein [Amycolatopsis sp. H20-H5]